MPVVQCKFEVAPGAVEMIEEQVALLADVQWTVWEEQLAGRTWVTGYFNSRDEATAAYRRLAAPIKPEWIAGEADWRERAARPGWCWPIFIPTCSGRGGTSTRWRGGPRRMAGIERNPRGRN
jgi:hypothetical protein